MSDKKMLNFTFISPFLSKIIFHFHPITGKVQYVKMRSRTDLREQVDYYRKATRTFLAQSNKCII